MGGGPAKEHLLCLLPGPEPKEMLDTLRKRFHNIEITYHQSSISSSAEEKERQLKALPDGIWKKVTILYTLFTFPDKPSDAPNLKLVQLVSAGSNQIQKHPIYTETSVHITTSSGIHGPQIAEWCIMTALVQSNKYN